MDVFSTMRAHRRCLAEIELFLSLPSFDRRTSDGVDKLILFYKFSKMEQTDHCYCINKYMANITESTSARRPRVITTL